MKSLLISTACTMLIITAFAKDNAVKNFLSTRENDTTIAGEWVLQPVLSSDTAAGKLPTISFNLQSKRFTGNTGCNAMTGHFFIKGDSLVFSEHIISTKKSCEGYNEKAFIENLVNTNRYKIEDGVLQLMRDQTILSRWTREPNTSLKNKT